MKAISNDVLSPSHFIRKRLIIWQSYANATITRLQFVNVLKFVITRPDTLFAFFWCCSESEKWRKKKRIKNPLNMTDTMCHFSVQSIFIWYLLDSFVTHKTEARSLTISKKRKHKSHEINFTACVHKDRDCKGESEKIGKDAAARKRESQHRKQYQLPNV